MFYASKPAPEPEPYPYGYSGMSGMGQVVPGVREDTQRLVIYGSLILVSASVLIYFALKGKGVQSAVTSASRRV